MTKLEERINEVVDPKLDAIRDLLLDDGHKHGDPLFTNLGSVNGSKSEINRIEHLLQPTDKTSIIFRQFMKELGDSLSDAIQGVGSGATEALKDAILETIRRLVPSVDFDMTFDIGDLLGHVLRSITDLSLDSAKIAADFGKSLIMGAVMTMKVGEIQNYAMMEFSYIREKLNKLQSQRRMDRDQDNGRWTSLGAELLKISDDIQNLSNEFNSSKSKIIEAINQGNQLLYQQLSNRLDDNLGQVIERVNELDSKITTLTSEIEAISRVLDSIIVVLHDHDDILTLLLSKINSVEKAVNNLTASSGQDPNVFFAANQMLHQQMLSFQPRRLV